MTDAARAPRRRRAPWELCAGAAAAVSAAALAALAAVTLARIGYAYPLEWQEGAMLEHARRVAAGEALYVAPGLDFAPFPYPPLFHWLGAGALAVLGDSLTSLRAVSGFALLVVFTLLAWSSARSLTAEEALRLRRVGGRALPAICTAGVLAAGTGFGGWFLDVARVDALLLALLAANLVAARAARSWIHIALAGLCGAAAVLTKQTALAPAFALALPIALRSGTMRAALYVLVVVGLPALWLAAADRATDGWASFTVIDLLRGSPWHSPAILGFWRESALALGLLVLAVLLARPRLDPFVATFALALVAIAWLGRAHEGGFDNTLLPAVLAVALIVGPAVSSAALRGRAVPLAVATLGVVALAYAGGDPRTRIPSASDRVRMERSLVDLGGLPRDAFVPDAPELARRAGHAPAVHAMAVVDLLKSREADVAASFVQELEEALRARRFGCVVLDEPWDLPALHECYEPVDTLELPAPRSGAPRVPRVIFLPR